MKNGIWDDMPSQVIGRIQALVVELRHIQKPFPKPRTGELGLFSGTAHWMGPNEPPPYVYRIKYDDDDEELMDLSEVQRWLID